MPHSQTSGSRLAAHQRRQQIIQLRTRGATLQQIADSLGVSMQRVHEILKEEMARAASLRLQAAQELLAQEEERIDACLRTAFKVMESGDQDADTRLRAIDRVLGCHDRRAKLFGLNAPEKVAQTTPDGKSPYPPITDAERAAKILELLGRARPQANPAPDDDRSPVADEEE